MTQTGSAGAGERLHYLDAARAFMLLVGVPFHAAEVYRVSGGFDIASPDTSWVASGFTAVVHMFRMPAFFMLSGFFSALLLDRRPATAWLRGRAKRLALPLVFTTLLLGPWEEALELAARSGQGVLASYGQALHEPARTWVNHRWFLIVLLLYSGLVAAGHGRWRGGVLRACALVERRSGMAAFMAVLMAVPALAVLSGKLMGDVLAHSVAVKDYTVAFVRYLPAFLLGYGACLSGRDGMMRGALSGTERVIAGLSVGLYLATYFGLYPPDFATAHPGLATPLRVVRHASEAVAGYWSARLLFLGFSRAFRERSAVIGWCVEASFVIYLVHKLFLNVLSRLFLSVGWDPLAEIALASLAALVGAMVVAEGVRRSAWLSLAMNGGPIRPVFRSAEPPSLLPRRPHFR